MLLLAAGSRIVLQDERPERKPGWLLGCIEQLQIAAVAPGRIAVVPEHIAVEAVEHIAVGAERTAGSTFEHQPEQRCKLQKRDSGVAISYCYLFVYNFKDDYSLIPGFFGSWN